MNAADSASAIRAWAAERRLPKAHLDRWLLMREADRAALLSLAQRLRLRTGQFVTALELLEEVVLREAISIDQILAREQLVRIVCGGGSTPGRARAALDALRAFRYPRLGAAASRLRREIASLELPHGVVVLLPENLSSDELKVQLTARSSRELARVLDAIASRRVGLLRIARMLGGEE